MNRRRLSLGLALAGLQVCFLLAYLGVERLHEESEPFRWEPLDEAVPLLEVHHDGVPVEVPPGVVIVHFWATWCAPCRTELPALLQAAEDQGIGLLAITEEPWPVVQRHFHGRVPDAIVQDGSGDTSARWRVSTLPDTFVVQNNRVTARMAGVRDWTSTEAVAFLRSRHP